MTGTAWQGYSLLTATPAASDTLLLLRKADTSANAAGTVHQVPVASLTGCPASADTSGATDTANIQGLLNLTGKAILQAGLFYLNETLTFSSSTGLYGAGKGVTTVRACASFAATQVGSNPGMVMLATSGNSAASNIRVQDLTLDGNETNISSLPGYATAPECSPVGFQNVTGLTIDHVGIANAIGYSIFPVSCTNVQVTNCVITSGQNSTSYNQQDGIHLSDVTGAVVAGNLIASGNNGGDDPIVVQGLSAGSTNVAITGNTVTSSGTHGIALYLSGAAVSGVTISGNTVSSTVSEGVLLSMDAWVSSGSYLIRDVTISGNTFRNISTGGAASGITLQDASGVGHVGTAGWQDVTIVGNVFDGFANPSGFGIFVSQGNNLQIMANTFDNWDAQYGIQIGNTNFGGTTVAEPVKGFQVIGNTISMATSTATGPTGIQVQDSYDGTIAQNTLTGPGSGVAGSTGILLINFAQASTGITVSGNVVTGWASGAVETNDGAQPDYNAYTGNLWSSVTTPLSLTGTHNTVLDATLNTFQGPATLSAGTSSAAPLNFKSGTLLTTPAAGAVEFDGTAYYLTAAASSRQVVDAEQFMCLSSSYTLTSSTSAQKLFNATSNGALTVQAGAYFFECEFDLSSLSATSGTFGFGLGGTATVSSVKFNSQAIKATQPGTAQLYVSTSATVSNTANQLVSASTTQTGGALIKGMVRISAAGTLIPQTALSVAAAAVVGANSWFRIWPVGSNAVTNVGDWS